MANVLEVHSDAVTDEQITALAAYAQDMSEGELRDLILALTTNLSDGSDVAMISTSEDYTPAQIAKRLKMSRTHLYKLLDSGQIPSHRVGRDRRISGEDVILFEKQRQRERRALTERLSNADALHRRGLDELAESLLDEM